mmetsp:Transcript_45617/g.121972  ORF Transcript_45617/g.121972 Transcript_45617/m.121972 type:complete len:246 (-) Transcript_45617:101-838(-)
MQRRISAPSAGAVTERRRCQRMPRRLHRCKAEASPRPPPRRRHGSAGSEHGTVQFGPRVLRDHRRRDTELQLCTATGAQAAVVLLRVSAPGRPGVVLFLSPGLLDLVQGPPPLGELVGLCYVVAHDDVIKNGTTLLLIHIEPQETKIRVRIHHVIVHILRVSDHPKRPIPPVRRVCDLLSAPFALVRRVVLHRGYPLTIILLIPTVWLRCRLVHDALLLHPIVWLVVLGILDFRYIHPILRLPVI